VGKSRGGGERKYLENFGVRGAPRQRGGGERGSNGGVEMGQINYHERSGPQIFLPPPPLLFPFGGEVS
jgi:hypothetical protein